MTKESLDEELRSIVGHNLKVLRERNGLTQQQVAHALGEREKIIQQYENGNAAKFSLVSRMADLYRESLDVIRKVRLPAQSYDRSPKELQESALERDEGPVRVPSNRVRGAVKGKLGRKAGRDD